MNKYLSTLVIGLLAAFAIVGCDNANGGNIPELETKYTDITADSIYGKVELILCLYSCL